MEVEKSTESTSEMLSELIEDASRSPHFNPWLQLHTITSFDRGAKPAQDIQDKISQLENYDQRSISSSNSPANESTQANSQTKKMSQNESVFQYKEIMEQKDFVSFAEEKQLCLPTSRNILNHKVSSRRSSHRLRSRKTSLSDGDVQNVGSGSCYAHISSNYPKNGTVSEAGGDSMLNNVAHCPQDPVETLSRFSPTSLLVESLIDQLCKLMEKDTARQKKLYHVICDRLHRMHLIDDTYTIEEFQFMRSHYQRALYQLLAVAKSSTNAPEERSIILPLPRANINVDVTLSSEQLLEWSRYYHEYQELEYIAKGGFGHVYKVRNKLDGGEYAIKKIYLRYCYIEGFLRSLKEVKMLARLNHPNIVSYKAAWLEPLDGSAHKPRVRRDSRSTNNVDASVSLLPCNSRPPLPPPSILPSDSSDIVFQETSPDTDSHTSNMEDKKAALNDGPERHVDCTKQSQDSSHRSKKLLSELLGTNSIVFQHIGSDDSSLKGKGRERGTGGTDTSGSSSEAAIFALSQSKEKIGWSDMTKDTPVALRNWATLYVQMQLCQRTLRQWLEERNSSLPAYPLGPNTKEGSLALLLFRKIVRGVEYIHSQGIVHHDIKPSNIFVNENLKEVQVGDFGLSCCLLSRVDHTGTVGDYHGGVGTRIYAAPEQLRGKCTPKSDIYSLGIVLLELLQPFHTDMERSKVIEKLRAGHLPSELSSTWPHAAGLMSDMLVNSPAARPTASELLNRVETLVKMNIEKDVSSQLATKDETIRLLKEAVASRDQEIAELRRRLSLFEDVTSTLPSCSPSP